MKIPERIQEINRLLPRNQAYSIYNEYGQLVNIKGCLVFESHHEALKKLRQSLKELYFNDYEKYLSEYHIVEVAIIQEQSMRSFLLEEQAKYEREGS